VFVSDLDWLIVVWYLPPLRAPDLTLLHMGGIAPRGQLIKTTKLISRYQTSKVPITVSDLRQAGCFLQVLWFHPPVKLTTTV
jgi:hypothetical protein